MFWLLLLGVYVLVSPLLAMLIGRVLKHAGGEEDEWLGSRPR